MFDHAAMLQLPRALTKRGGNVFLVDGWGSRGAAGRPMANKVYGSIQHWIVSKQRGDADENQTLGLIVNGHSTLSGPLANLYLRWDGAIGVVAAGRANHGGEGSWNGISGNQFWIGTEAEGPPFTEAQMAAYPIILAAVYDVTGQHPRDWAISHQEYAPRRKVDIGPAINQIRDEAVRLVDNHIFDTEDDMTPEQASKLDFIYDSILYEPGGYGFPEANSGKLDQIIAMIQGPDDRWNMLQAIMSYLPSVYQRAQEPGAVIDEEKIVEAINAAIPQGLEQRIIDELGKRIGS